MNLTETLNDREEKYGDFGRLADAIQAMKNVARSAPGWLAMNAVQREAMDMVMVKQARLLYGDPQVRDSWLDLSGYAHLAVEQMDREAAQRPKKPGLSQDAFEPPVDLDELAGNITPMPRAAYP